MRWARLRLLGAPDQVRLALVEQTDTGQARVPFPDDNSGLRLTSASDLSTLLALPPDRREKGAHDLLEDSTSTCSLRDVELLAPIVPVGDVIAIGRNYAEHAAEMTRAGRDPTARPTVFSKAQTSVNSPFGSITVDPAVSEQVDWEAELAVIIGSGPVGAERCRNISPERALDYVFGYTVVNDVSARDLQYGWGGQFYKGKSLDGYCPIGPCIVTADSLEDPGNLDIMLRVNGELKQQGNTGEMIFPIPELIAQLSLGQTLLPGSVIATGTPPGVGFARDPKEFLRPGDVMETEIVGIGLLRNVIQGV